MDPSILETVLSRLSSKLSERVSISGSPIHSWQNFLCPIRSGTGGRWLLCIPKDADTANHARPGFAILEQLKILQPELMIPSILVQTDEYQVFEALEGAPLSSWSTTTLSQDRRRALLDALAVVLYALWTIPSETFNRGTGKYRLTSFLELSIALNPGEANNSSRAQPHNIPRVAS